MDNEKLVALLRGISRLGEFSPESLEFQILCSGITIASLDASEELFALELPAAEGIAWHEIANALKQIAFHALELQSAGDGADPHGGQDVPYHLGMILRHAEYIQKTVPLPGELVVRPPYLPAAEEKVRPEQPELLPESGRDEAGRLAVWNGEDAAARLRREIKALREQLITLTIEKDNLENVEGPRLSAEYMVKIGSLNMELFEAETELRRVKRMVVLAREALRRKEKVSRKDVDARILYEFQDYKAKYDEYARKRREAEDYLRRKAEKAEKARKSEEQRHRSAAGGPSGKADVPAEAGREENGAKSGRDNGPDCMKRLYRKIVKAMHPDLHPGQTEQEKDLFKKANAAYEDGDLETLEKIYAMIGAEPGPDPDGRAEIEALIREKQKLLDMIRGIRAETGRILNSFPFTMKELLNDPEALAAMRAEISRRIETARQQTGEYRKKYESIMKEGKAE